MLVINVNNYCIRSVWALLLILNHILINKKQIYLVKQYEININYDYKKEIKIDTICSLVKVISFYS